jgi:IS30 family transposase
MDVKITVQGRPYHSSLVPYEDEILELRHRRPPTPYRQIAELLFQKYQLRICRETIFKFIRTRSRTRKMFGYKRLPSAKRPKSVQKPLQRVTTDSDPKPKFEFEYSERYNLKRLPPEEAAAIRKKLEAEGH